MPLRRTAISSRLGQLKRSPDTKNLPLLDSGAFALAAVGLEVSRSITAMTKELPSGRECFDALGAALLSEFLHQASVIHLQAKMVKGFNALSGLHSPFPF